MAYQAQISRANPSAYLFLLDQSSSMNETMAHSKLSLAQFLSGVINRTLWDLMLMCQSGQEDILDRYHIAALSYSGEDNVQNAFKGVLAARHFNPISQIAANPLRMEKRTIKVPDDSGGFSEESIDFEVWVEPNASGRTPMLRAMRQARDLLRRWCDEHPNSFPPLLMHVTDGAPHDGSLDEVASVAEEIKSLKTNDGNCLICTLHITRHDIREVLFPSSTGMLPSNDDFAAKLFSMSSDMPPGILAKASNRVSVAEGAKFFAYNAGPEAIVHFFKVGTEAANAAVATLPDA